MTMPGSHSLFQPCSPHCPCQEETTELQWGWRHQSQDMEKQHWKNPTWCSGAVKTFTHYGMVLHEPATTAKNKQVYTELSGSSASICQAGRGCIFPEWIDFSKIWAALILARIWLTVRLWAMMDVSPSQRNRNSQIAQKQRVKIILSLFTAKQSITWKTNLFCCSSWADLNKLLEQTVDTGSALGWGRVHVRVGCSTWAQPGLTAWAGSAANQTGSVQWKSLPVRWRQWWRKNQSYWTWEPPSPHLCSFLMPLLPSASSRSNPSDTAGALAAFRWKTMESHTQRWKTMEYHTHSSRKGSCRQHTESFPLLSTAPCQASSFVNVFNP